jgi:DNA invertase Pin-like site-specific DNA recombinase
MLTMRYVIYLRVSTETQAAEGQGLAVQEDACRSWARAGKHRVAAVCTDAGVSGTADVGERPALAEAMAHLLDGRADGIVVARLDRLARDVVLQEQLLAELHRMGAELHSASPTEDAHLGDDPDDPTRALVRRILGAIGQYEREVIRLRLRAGAARKLQSTGYSAGRPPYGWTVRGRALEPVPEEHAVIERILRHHRDGLSTRQIGAVLESNGIRSRTNTGKWNHTTVGAIIRRGTERPDYRKAA